MGVEKLSDLIDKGKEAKAEISGSLQARQATGRNCQDPSTHADTLDYVNDLPAHFLPSLLLFGKVIGRPMSGVAYFSRKSGGHTSRHRETKVTLLGVGASHPSPLAR